MSSTGYTRADLDAVPQWHVGESGEAFIAKGAFVAIVLQESHDGSVYLYSHGELIAVRHGKDAAVELAEKLVARWFPADPAVLKPEAGPVAGDKAADGKKFISSNPYGAPV